MMLQSPMAVTSWLYYENNISTPCLRLIQADGDLTCCRLDKAHIVCASTHGHMWHSWPCFATQGEATWGTSNRSPMYMLWYVLLNISFLCSFQTLRTLKFPFIVFMLTGRSFVPGCTTGGKTASSANFEVVRWFWVTKTATQRQESTPGWASDDILKPTGWLPFHEEPTLCQHGLSKFLKWKQPCI